MFFKTTINQKQQRQNSEGKKQFSVFCIVKKKQPEDFFLIHLFMSVSFILSLFCAFCFLDQKCLSSFLFHSIKKKLKKIAALFCQLAPNKFLIFTKSAHTHKFRERDLTMPGYWNKTTKLLERKKEKIL
jgi:hypothetical protein